MCDGRSSPAELDGLTAQLLARAQSGERLALARLISAVENGSAQLPALLRQVYPLTGRAWMIGVTGPPGAGKSTLVNRLVGELRRAHGKVGVVAVDPTSPFSGGAILGDRLRMQDWSTDPGVFIRSMAARGHLGGLSLATRDVARLLDACGYEVVVIETVGTGQSEVDIMDLAHTVLVVLAPGLGDEVQAQKAGILEIADLLVVNKADRDGADQLVAQLQATLDLAPQLDWRPPVIRSVATTGEGVRELLAASLRHREWMGGEGRGHRRLLRRTATELEGLIGRLAAAGAVASARRRGLWDQAVAAVASRQVDPYTAALRLLSERSQEPPSGS